MEEDADSVPSMCQALSGTLSTLILPTHQSNYCLRIVGGTEAQRITQLAQSYTATTCRTKILVCLSPTPMSGMLTSHTISKQIQSSVGSDR